MRTSCPMPFHAALAGLALAVAAPGVLAQAPAACAGLRGGELVISASPACVGRLQGDAGLKRQVASTIQAEAGGGAVVGAAAANGRPAAGARPHGLTHPLARLSSLNAQSRYLWSLANPAPSYYGQTATR
ncbi:hypothetical protein [Ideonella sp.]|uniref:hypothetical protein n=1 Tax=Ideonella sp. TaxID=1929293 RepID=UPI0035B2ACF8